MILLNTTLSSVYLIRLKERFTLSGSLSHAFYVMKGNFWWTWLIMFVVYLCVAIIQMIFVIPQSIMTAVMAFSSIRGGEEEGASIALVIVSSAGTFFSTLMYFIFIVFSTVHYFSLLEKKEGKGLMERIDEIGTRKDNSIEGTY